MKRGDWEDVGGYEEARRGTVYWTLSLYIDADRVARAVGRPGIRVTPDDFAEVQKAHPPSVALRDAIDPLFNDIADREVQGAVQEHLLAAGDCREDLNAAECARGYEKLDFVLPTSIVWETEGLTFEAAPPDLDIPRVVRLRRFWFAHPNGALSYHLSFSHHYGSLHELGDGLGYDPSTYYFLSLLQKLAAPKEFKLSRAGPASVFDANLGIAPLDKITVQSESGQELRFWPFVRDRLRADGRMLFARVLAKMEGGAADERRVDAIAPDLPALLLDEAPFIEVPGLKVPKSRFMFMIDDDRFFDHLLPLDPATSEPIARKMMVREQCYKRYGDRIETLAKDAGQTDGVVRLDDTYWTWVKERHEYLDLIAGEEPKLRQPGGEPFEDLKACARAIRVGKAETTVDDDLKPLPSPVTVHIPAFKPNRSDCLDYLFLAGFNQNIIDFMNQDTSEILDSIDPIYPDSEDQAGERFFIRYANHRAMLTYVPRSRSLETGNDYIGTCPYAFLIHVMSLHNEFLAREHELKSMTRVERIEHLVAKAQGRTPPPLGSHARQLEESEGEPALNAFDQAESAINQLKLANYKDYERFRYSNPFRYDTERDVFEKLRELRGTARKQAALKEAIDSLEDHARDLHQRHQSNLAEAAARREREFNILLGSTGIFGAGQMIYWIGESAAGDPGGAAASAPEPVSLDFLGLPWLELPGDRIMQVTEALMGYMVIFFVGFLLWIILPRLWAWITR